MTSFSIQSFGCRVNQAEAFEWAAVLQERGWALTELPRDGGLIIVNTCTLTARADRDSRKFIRRAGREHPESKIVVTGCLAERSPAGLLRMPGVWQVFSNRDKERLPAGILDAAGAAAPAGAPAPARFRARAFLKVQDGCDMSCAFCVIPSVRGRSASLPLASAVERARRLAARGYAEIVLTGIHLCSYGRDLAPRASFLDLLQALDAAPEAFAVRLSSLDPRLMPAPLVDRLAASPKIRPHFHLSLQHAAPLRLEAMGRASTPAGYESLLGRLSRGRPEAALGADLIVGFPGETDAEFASLAEFVDCSPLTYLHVFAYSPRPGTSATTLARAFNTWASTGETNPQAKPGAPAPVDDAVKNSRAARLRAIGARKDRAFRERFQGREMDGIVIRSAAASAEVLTANGIAVTIAGRGPARGEAVRVRIIDAGERKTLGELIE
ncbi:MAG: MiaB/RimO family radical SAM methylthiotransferase [Candidatus Aminicenantales bacterium]|jgi:threonylcarbamoyladenosine tRNA methylthiotransferase MtaB